MITRHDGAAVTTTGAARLQSSTILANGDVRSFSLARGTTCDVCGSTGALSLCGGCRLRRYCGRACQRAEWARHKGTCARMRETIKVAAAFHEERMGEQGR